MNKIFEDILTLVKAGYSKEEIDVILNVKPSAEDAKPSAEDAKPSAEDAKPSAEEPETSVAALAKFQKSLDDFGKKLEAYNILNSSIQDKKEVSAEDALAKILNPQKEG